nr:hypothetical protein [Lentzea pudingi]
MKVSAIFSTVCLPESYICCAVSSWRCGDEGPATDAAAGSRGGEAVHRAFDDHLSVVLGQCREEVEHQPPAGAGGVDALFQHDEVDVVAPNQRTSFSKCCWKRPIRLSRITTTSSPVRSRSSMVSSFGREESLPETSSMNMFSSFTPAAASAST